MELRLPEARALAARAVAAAVGYAGAQDAETLVLAMRVRAPWRGLQMCGLCDALVCESSVQGLVSSVCCSRCCSKWVASCL